jgi:hypothetical protein
MELARVRGGGATWLGARSVSAAQALDPVIGPIDSAAGIQFTYRDASGAATMVPSAVRQIEVLILGVTTQAVNEGVGPGPGRIGSDSLRVQFAVRNSR